MKDDEAAASLNEPQWLMPRLKYWKLNQKLSEQQYVRCWNVRTFGVRHYCFTGTWPEKLPQAARFVGKWYGKMKRLVSNVQNDLDRELRLSELREQMRQEMQRIAELEQKNASSNVWARTTKREMFVQPSKQEQTTDNISYPTYHYMKEHSSYVYVKKIFKRLRPLFFLHQIINQNLRHVWVHPSFSVTCSIDWRIKTKDWTLKKCRLPSI